MDQHLDHHSQPNLSPFDAIRRADDAGEFWMARDLQPLMGYARWEDFAKVTRRAHVSATNSGASEGFSEITEELRGGGRPRQNYRLSRFAAYLVAMNGDPNMPEVAAAQAYFAVRTREAEVASNQRALPHDYEEALLALVDAERSRKRELKAREAAQAYARELEPKADAYDQFMTADGTYAIGTVAKMLTTSQNRLFDLLRNAGVLIAKGHMRNTPYQAYMHHFTVTAHEYERADGTRGTSYTTRVQPSGIQFISRKLGIPIREQITA
ncbi:DNA damage-inducible protein D [Mariniluteicoccus endophyticus]